MKQLFEPIEAVEAREDELRTRISQLSDEARKRFYNAQCTILKDPDTYATLNWLFLGGVHHLYLEKYLLFAIECTLLIVCIIGLLAGMPAFWLGILAITLYELPQLFFSQKIVRQYNYDRSLELLERVQ